MEPPTPTQRILALVVLLALLAAGGHCAYLITTDQADFRARTQPAQGPAPDGP